MKNFFKSGFCDILLFVNCTLKFLGNNIRFARVGGNSDNGLLCGSFSLAVNNAVTLSNWNYGASLCC